MKLLDDKTLAWSAVVANNAMNRSRQAVGINSYEKDIRLNPITFLQKRIANSSSPTIQWLDLCCGEGNALIQTAQHFKQHTPSKHLQVKGIDLVDFFAPYPPQLSSLLTLQQMNLSEWTPTHSYDLISIVHGLHYLGDKLGLICKAAAALQSDGLFIGNLDWNNITVLNQKGENIHTAFLKNYFKQTGIQYHSKTKILQVKGQKILPTSWVYLGANDKAGANYTGQPAVQSVYRLILND